jgi:PPM family protein phosphatase
MSPDPIPPQEFGPRLEVAARTIIAPKMGALPENEDNYLLIDAQGQACHLLGQQERASRAAEWPAGWVRVAVMDGMGGHGRGREAAEAIAAGLLAIPPAPDAAELGRRLDGLHRELRARLHRPGHTPGATLTLLDIPPFDERGTVKAQLFHVGDSRLYRIEPAGCEPLTIDQVPATALAMGGQIDEAQWRREVHEQNRFLLSQGFILGNSLENGNELRPGLHPLDDAKLPPFLQGLGDRRAIELRPGDLLLLGSDGLWAQNDPAAFIRTWPGLLRKPGKPVQSLLDDLFVELVLGCTETQHLDNATGVLVRIGG